MGMPGDKRANETKAFFFLISQRENDGEREEQIVGRRTMHWKNGRGQRAAEPLEGEAGSGLRLVTGHKQSQEEGLARKQASRSRSRITHPRLWLRAPTGGHATFRGTFGERRTVHHTSIRAFGHDRQERTTILRRCPGDERVKANETGAFSSSTRR